MKRKLFASLSIIFAILILVSSVGTIIAFAIEGSSENEMLVYGRENTGNPDDASYITIEHFDGTGNINSSDENERENSIKGNLYSWHIQHVDYTGVSDGTVVFTDEDYNYTYEKPSEDLAGSVVCTVKTSSKSKSILPSPASYIEIEGAGLFPVNKFIFENCTSLTSIPVIQNNYGKIKCSNCSSLTTFEAFSGVVEISGSPNLEKAFFGREVTSVAVEDVGSCFAYFENSNPIYSGFSEGYFGINMDYGCYVVNARP